MGGSLDDLEPYDRVLVRFSGDPVQVRGYLEAKTMFGEGEKAKSIIIRYMIVNTTSSYNELLGRPIINKLGAIVSSIHMNVKYPMDEGTIGVLIVYQRAARKCYKGSLKIEEDVCR